MRSRPAHALCWTLLAACASAASPCAAQVPGAPEAGAAPPLPKLELAERIVAVVDERPLLLSDVRALAAVRRLAPEQALEALIEERLMLAEVSRAAQATVSRQQEDEALVALVAANKELTALVPEPDLRRLARRQLAILQYVELRFRPQVQVSDEDVRRAWELEQAAPAGTPLEDAQAAIRSRLERRALDERIEAWVAELRARADVRYVGAAPAGP
jgi:hypothetical protein